MNAARWFLMLMVCAALIWPRAGAAAEQTPAAQAETLRAALVQTQLQFGDSAAARQALGRARAAHGGTFAATLAAADSVSDGLIQRGFAAAEQAQAASDAPAFAAARTQIWTAVLAGSYQVVEQALAANNFAQAQQWLAVREFRIATRFARPSASATVALEQAAGGSLSAADALLAVRADVLDTYEARLNEALRDLRANAGKDWFIQQVEQAGLAAGYFEILAAAFREQRGEPALAAVRSSWTVLLKAAAGGSAVLPALDQVEAQLKGFRAAPLSKAEQARRAGQLLRFLGLVPVEYGRGVKNGVVTRDLEVREATTFHEGAAAAFSDLRSLLEPLDSAKTEQVAQLLAEQARQLSAASQGQHVPDPDVVQATTDQILELLAGLMPQEWQKNSSSGDFDVIASMLDQMQSAAAAGEYDLAQSARLEAYAILESGPEARLIVFAPQYKVPIEDLFWYGQGEQIGLAKLIEDRAPATTIRASRLALDAQLAAAEQALGGSTAPAAVASNAAIIVFREGLEAVLILASLMGSFKLGEQRRLRRPLWFGAALAFAASVLTWMLARGILLKLARYGERLEAVVSLIAIGVLLLITNWFFHKVYWTGWMANFHAKKRRIVGGEAGLWLGLMALGFTSIYREGFESVLFLQALVLEAGSSVVLSGVALGLAGAFLIGILVFVLQAKLPHKKMLIVTGVMIGAVLLVMVGNTAHVLQVVGWLPIHPIREWNLPYWSGLWFGFFATYEGVGLQVAAATFVIGSYVLAERVQHKRTKHAVARQSAQPGT